MTYALRGPFQCQPGLDIICPAALVPAGHHGGPHLRPAANWLRSSDSSRARRSCSLSPLESAQSKRAPVMPSSAIERTEDWRSWKSILEQAGVRDARVHDARHTAATLLIEQGVHIRVVQEVLGHTRVTTTERYTHVATLRMRDASERIGQALWGQG
jgi:integrase